jgi:CRISPR-associated protein Cas1
VDINKRLLEFLTQSEILLHFFNRYGYYVGSFYPREHYNSGCLILNQAQHYNDPAKRLSLAQLFVKGVAENIKRVIRYYLRREIKLEQTADTIDKASQLIDEQNSVDALMVVEGSIRDAYFQSFNNILKHDMDFTFEKRSRRPPENRLNALISFGNSLLYVAVLSEIYRTHLDPRIGYLHATNFRRFSLNLDVAEIFKPVLVDRLIFSLINKGQIQAKHFSDNAGGIYLSEAGRKIFVEEWEKRLRVTLEHPRLKRNVSYRRLIRIELYKIEKHLLGDEQYVPFIARW